MNDGSREQMPPPPPEEGAEPGGTPQGQDLPPILDLKGVMRRAQQPPESSLPRFIGHEDKPPRDMEDDHEKAMKLLEERKFAEAFQTLAPEATEENKKLFEAVVPILDEEYRNVTDEKGNLIEGAEEQINDQKINELLVIVSLAQSNPDEAREKLDMLDIPEDQKEAIRNQIPKEAAQSEDRPLTEEEQARQDQATGLRDEINEQIEALKNEAASEKPNSLRQRFLQNRLGALESRMEHIKHWFKQPKEVWAGRLGKTVLATVVALALFVLWEMNMINKIAGKK